MISLRLTLISVLAISALTATCQTARIQARQSNEKAGRTHVHPLILQPGSSWPKVQGNNQNTGQGLGSGSDGIQKWAYVAKGGFGNASSAIAADGTIYIGSFDSNLYALQPDGTLKWQFATTNAIISSPAIGSDGTVYIGSEDSYLYAVNPDGTQQWKCRLGSVIEGQPAIGSDGTVYVAAEDNQLHAVGTDGTEKWRVPVGYSTASPAIASDGTIYIGTDSKNLYALNTDGTTKWSYPTGGAIEGSPTVGTDGTIYVGSDDGYLYAVHSDGSAKWSHSFGGYATYTSIASDGTIYVGASTSVATAHQQFLYAFDASGTLKWQFSPPQYAGVDNRIFAPAIGSDGTIYFSTSLGVLYAVNATGAESWEFLTKLGIECPPAIGSDGTVYVAGYSDWTLYAIGTKNTGFGISGLKVSPSLMLGGTPATGTITLSTAAPAGGVTVGISSDNVSASAPTTVSIPAGATSASFAIFTSAVGVQTAVTFRATLGTKAVATIVTLRPASLIGITAQAQIVGGNVPNQGTVTLGSAAPTGGLVLNLKSSDPSVTVPSTVTVAGGSTSANFSMSTSGVDSSTKVTLTATQGSSNKTCVMTVLPASLISLQLTPSSVAGDSSTPVSAVIKLNGNAGPSGIVLSLASSNTAAATVPATTTVSAGAHVVNVTVAHLPVSSSQSTTISATYGATTQNAVLSVVQVSVASVQTPTMFQIVGGNTPNPGLVTLTGNAPAGGMVVNLSSSDPCLSVPTSVTVPEGTSSVNYSMTTSGVDTTKAVTITATQGSTTKTCNVNVLPAVLLNIQLSTSTVVGSSGTTVTATVRINGKAGPSGITINLASSNTAAATVPATLTIPAGAIKGSFTVAHFTVATSTTSTITATYGPGSLNATLTITP